MNKSVIFISFTMLMLCIGCEKQWLQNRFNISGITIDSISESKIYLNFQLTYYSDSTTGFYIMQGIEKGQGGSDFEIDKIGIHGSDQKISNQVIDSNNTNDKDFQSMEDLKYHFNLKHRNTIGQRLSTGAWVTIEKNLLDELRNKKAKMYFILKSNTSKYTVLLRNNF